MIPLQTPGGPAPSPFNPEQQSRFDAEFERSVSKYPSERRRAALLPVLHHAQDLLGWLTEPALAYVGFRLDIPPVRVREVATFYTMYRLKPVGRHAIGVCNSVSCWAMGSEQILKRCEEKLGIRTGETTRDGQFSLEEVACLAACGYAPAVLVNNYTYFENVTPQSLDAMLDSLKGQPGNAMAPAPAPRKVDLDRGQGEAAKQTDAQVTGPAALASRLPTRAK